jgi:integrase
MTEEKDKRQRGTGSIYQPKHSRFLWVKYYRNGKPYRESTHLTDERKAQKFLQKRLGEIGAGHFLGPSVEKIRVSELAEDMFRDYRVNGHKSLQFTEWRWKKHLEPMFGPMRAVEVTTDAVTKYIVSRKAEGAENATINREFAALKRMFSLGYRSTPRKVYQVPVFPRLKENAPRSGFIEQKQYRQLCEHCSELWLRTMLALGYSFGFRKGELLNMRARQVDLLNRSLVLEPGTTKNSEGRSVKLTSETLELVRQCMSTKSADNYLLTRKGNRPIRDFRGAWDKLTIAAKLPGLLFHDMRRSAVRNMVRRGVPEVVAMRISGHKTRSVFDRYNIVSESGLTDAAKRIERGSKLESGHTSGIQEQAEQTDSSQLHSEPLYNQ